MSSESPSSVIYSSLGVEISASNGAALASTQSGLLVDGYNYASGLAQLMAVDATGHTIVVGSGVAGTPAGGVLTIQGVAGGQAIPVSGTITASNPSISTIGTTVPASATYIGGSVTTTAPAYTTGQMDSISLTTSGLLRIDGVYPVNITTPTTDIAFVGGAVTTAAPVYITGQLSALSLTTVGNLRVDGSSVIQPVSGTVVANQGTANTAANAWTTLVTDGTNTLGVAAHPFVVTGSGIAGAPATGVVTIQGITSGTPIPVSGTFVVDKSSTGTITSVAASVSSVSLLTSNANRVSATVYNDSSSRMYLALASSASTTAFTIKLLPNSYWELSVAYTGVISAVWDSAGSGSARITELT